MKAVKLQYFSLLLIFLLSLSSCSKNSEPKRGIGQSQETEALLSLRLKRANAVTLRAGTNDNDPMLKIQNLRFVFYKGSDGSEVVVQVIDKPFSETMTDGFDLKLVPNDYKLIVLANPSGGLKEHTTIGSPMSNMTQAQELSTSSIYTIDNGGRSISIPMANEQGLISIQRSQFHESEASSTSLSPIEIKLETMLARVLVFGTPQIKGIKPSGLQASYLINNLARAVAPLRPLANLYSGELEQQGDNSAKINRYALSTLWTKWGSETPTNTDLIASYSEENYANHTSWQGIKASREDYNLLLDKSVFLYAKETTLPPRAYLQGMTPCVIIKYPYAPEGLSLKSQEGWLSYKGSYYTESQAKDLLSPSNSTSSPLKTALTEAGITIDDFQKGFKKGEIAFYHQAYNYYTVYIRHFEGAKTKEAYGRYGIVRGNEYRIEIQSIEQAGSPIPPIFSGNTEAIPELESSAIKVSVSELTTREQEIKL